MPLLTFISMINENISYIPPTPKKIIPGKFLYNYLIISSILYFIKEPSRSSSHGNWIYNYLITTNVISSNPAQARCTRYNTMWSSLSVTCGRSMVSSTNKTDRHDITEIMLKVALNIIILTPSMLSETYAYFILDRNKRY